MHGIYRLTAEELAAAHVQALKEDSKGRLRNPAVKAMIEAEWARRSRLKLPERMLVAS